MWHVICGLDSFNSSEKEKTRKAGEAVFTVICEVAKTQEINLTQEYFLVTDILPKYADYYCGELGGGEIHVVAPSGATL